MEGLDDFFMGAANTEQQEEDEATQSAVKGAAKKADSEQQENVTTSAEKEDSQSQENGVEQTESGEALTLLGFDTDLFSPDSCDILQTRGSSDTKDTIFPWEVEEKGLKEEIACTVTTSKEKSGGISPPLLEEVDGKTSSLEQENPSETAGDRHKVPLSQELIEELTADVNGNETFLTDANIYNNIESRAESDDIERKSNLHTETNVEADKNETVVEQEVTTEIGTELNKQREESSKDDSEVKNIFYSDDPTAQKLIDEIVTKVTMPEKSEAIPQSPTLQRASCRYRWAQTVPTQATEVYFYLSLRKDDGVKLTWTESASCYYSEELDIPIGIYNGELVVDGKTYSVEDINIKHYTFEADLFVKDDLVSADETDNNVVEQSSENEQLKPNDTSLSDYKINKMEENSETKIHLSNKYEELLRQQLSQKSLELDADDRQSRTSQKSDHSSGRHTPIGDVAIEAFQDGDLDLIKTGTNLSFSKDSLENSLVEDEVERSSILKSANSSLRKSPQNFVQDVIENDLRRTPVKSPVTSARQTPSQADIMAEIIGGDGRTTPLRSKENSLNGSAIHTPTRGINVDEYRSPVGSATHSVHSSARHTPVVDDVLDNVGSNRSGQNSVHSSARQTPQQTLVSDILSQQRASPVRSEHSGSIHGSNRPPSQPHSEHSSARQTPVSHREMISDALRLSQERLYGSQQSLGHHSGTGGSRPQSLTSEQELTQYFEQNSRGGSEKVQVKQSPIGKLPSPIADRSSVQSTSSLPVITTQQRIQAEKRSMTPENHVRVPGAGSPIARSSSAANRSAASSRASTRTITPTSANGVLENGQTEEIHLQRIQDLEDSVRNLRKLLSSREMEVHELTKQLGDFKEINKELRQELDHARSRKSPSSHYAELDLKNKQLVEEKEILSAKVVKMQDLVDELRKGRDAVLEGGIDGESQSIRHYNPNNPETLQRKIADLESHIQDLQEANESAMAEVTMSERKLEKLLDENRNLKKGQDHHINLSDLEIENKRLHDKISKMWEEGYGDFDHRTRVESQQLRDDNRALRERNYKLHEENVKFKEELTELRRTLERSNAKVAPQQEEVSYRSLTLSSTRPDIERSFDSKLASEHKSSLKANEKLLLANERSGYLPNEDSRHVRSSSNKIDMRFRSSLDREDQTQSSKFNGETRRLKASDIYQRKDRELRSSSDKKESKYSYDSYDRIQSRHEKEADKSVLDRSFERMKYDYEEFGGSRAPNYRTRPDGDCSAEKEKLSSSLNYDKQLDRSPRNIYDSDLLGTDRVKQDTYRKDNYLADENRRLSLDRDYRSYKEPRSESADHNRDGYPSESSSYLSNRGRSKSCSEGLNIRASSYLPPPVPLQSVYHPSRYHSNIGYLPKPSFLWDDKDERRLETSQSERSETSRLGLSDRYSKTTPAHYQSSSHRRDDVYDRGLGKSYDSHGKPPPVPTYADDPGEVSDTATDILVNAIPFEKMSPSESYISSAQRYEEQQQKSHHEHSSRHQHHYSERQPVNNRYEYRRRRELRASAGSDSSPGSDNEEQYNIYSLHQRSKSADGRELRGTRAPPTGSTSRSTQNLHGTRRNDDSLDLSLPSGFRSTTPHVLLTQHNKNLLTTTSGSLQSLTSGMRPFAPRSPADINIQDAVKFSRQGGKLSQGEVKYVGHLPGRSDVYLGIELDKEDGKHDGKFEGNRYFRCKPNKGVFVAFNKVVMAWSPI